jgi:hypothetical protein
VHTGGVLGGGRDSRARHPSARPRHLCRPARITFPDTFLSLYVRFVCTLGWVAPRVRYPWASRALAQLQALEREAKTAARDAEQAHQEARIARENATQVGRG